MAKRKTKYWLILGIIVFFVYIFAAAQPVPRETILVPRWLTSLESGRPIPLGEGGVGSGNSLGDPELVVPFSLGSRFGYFTDNGEFTINQARTGYVALSRERWSEYEAVPASLSIRDPQSRTLFEIEEPRGYPFFLDGKTFLLGKGQDSISAVGESGEILWSYDFPAPLTCVDAAAGFILAGTLDGTVELINEEGRQVIPSFEPGGSRLAVILGCAVSKDASRLALISGIDDQRFVLLERSGDRYRVVYHEFLSRGERRPLHITFVDNDSRVVFEREGGVGIYNIDSRESVTTPLRGEITAIDESGTDGVLFLVSAAGPDEKRLFAIKYPDTVVIDAPFRSRSSFLGRRDSRVFIGGDLGLVSLEMGKK